MRYLYVMRERRRYILVWLNRPDYDITCEITPTHTILFYIGDRVSSLNNSLGARGACLWDFESRTGIRLNPGEYTVLERLPA